MARPTNKARVLRLLADFGEYRENGHGWSGPKYLPLSRVRETIGGVRTDAAILDLIEDETIGVRITADGVLLAYEPEA